MFIKVDGNLFTAETIGAATLISDYRPESPGKSGMFRKKRWSTSEEETLKKMKKLGVSQNALNSEVDNGKQIHIPPTTFFKN